MARPRTAPSASTMSVATWCRRCRSRRRVRGAGHRGVRCGRAACGRPARASSMHRQAELAGQQQRAGAEERDVLAGPAIVAFVSLPVAASGPVASCRMASSHGSPRAVTVPTSATRRTSSALTRWAMAPPSARPAVRTTPRARSSPSAARAARASRLNSPGRLEDSRGTRDGLEAAIATAVAGIAIGVDDDVADLAGRLTVAAEELVAQGTSPRRCRARP